jgi:hypothetical protein
VKGRFIVYVITSIAYPLETECEWSVKWVDYIKTSPTPRHPLKTRLERGRHSGDFSTTTAMRLLNTLPRALPRAALPK